jgi:hypothetical protein
MLAVSRKQRGYPQTVGDIHESPVWHIAVSANDMAIRNFV